MKTKIFSFLSGVAVTITPILFFTCCLSDFDQTIDFIIDPRLKTHVDNFFAEAEIRGIHIERENLVVRVDEYPKNVSKKCGCQRVVIITKNSYDHFTSGHWVKGDSAYYGLENLVFHELGHSLLGRSHCDPCGSIMASGASMYVYAKSISKRRMLLNELFGKNIKYADKD